jgi:multicomponent Na+:H+ antiporter subunit C
MRKLMGVNILQTAVIAFYLLLAVKSGGDVPILAHHGEALAKHYINPLPHALMLTAIVVGVSTTGVALALLIRIHRRYKTLDERDILKQIEASGEDAL